MPSYQSAARRNPLQQPWDKPVTDPYAKPQIVRGPRNAFELSATER